MLQCCSVYSVPTLHVGREYCSPCCINPSEICHTLYIYLFLAFSSLSLIDLFPPRLSQKRSEVLRPRFWNHGVLLRSTIKRTNVMGDYTIRWSNTCAESNLG